MSIPAHSIVPPTLETWQLSYGGLNFGGFNQASAYSFLELPEGIDIPDYVTGDQQRALDEGEYAGLDLSPGRNVTIKQIIAGETELALEEARQAFAGVLVPKGSQEEPLYIQLASGIFACMARPRKHKFSAGQSEVLEYATTATTLWHATDPRWYSMPSLTSTVGLPELKGGIVFPVTPPFLFVGGSAGSTVAVANTGLMEMRPTLVFTGPLKGPRVANTSLSGAPSLRFNLSLNAGDTLTVDLEWQSVVVRTAGTTAGSSRRALASGTWFNCPPGTSNLAFSSEDTAVTGGTMTVEWAPARMGL
jgi:hypothetical protein